MARKRALDPADAAADIEHHDRSAEQTPLAQPIDNLSAGAVERFRRAERIQCDGCFRRERRGAVELIADCSDAALPLAREARTHQRRGSRQTGPVFRSYP